MPGLHRIRITCPDGVGVLTRVEVDGQEVRGAVLAGFRVDAEGRAVVVLELVADQVEIEGDAEIVRGLREGAAFDASLVQAVLTNAATVTRIAAAVDRALYEAATRSPELVRVDA